MTERRVVTVLVAVGLCALAWVVIAGRGWMREAQRESIRQCEAAAGTPEVPSSWSPNAFNVVCSFDDDTDVLAPVPAALAVPGDVDRGPAPAADAPEFERAQFVGGG